MCLASRSSTEIRISQYGIISINHGQNRVVQGFLLQYPMQAAKMRWHFYCVAWWESQVSLCENEGTVYLFTYINLEPGFFGVYWVYLIYFIYTYDTEYIYTVCCCIFLISTSFRVDPISVPHSSTVVLEGHVSVRLLRMDTETPWLRLCYWSSFTDFLGTMSDSKTVLMLMICQSPMFFSCIHPLLSFLFSIYPTVQSHTPTYSRSADLGNSCYIDCEFYGSIALFGSRFREETLNLGGKRYLCLPRTAPEKEWLHHYIYV